MDGELDVSDHVDNRIAELYREFFRGVYGYCAYRLFKRDLAEDATSAVFLRLVEKYPALKTKSETEIRNWLYGTASNLVAKYLREAKYRRKIFAELARERESNIARTQVADDRPDWPEIYSAVTELKPQDQEIIALRFSQGFGTSAIAEILGMRHVTVRVRLSRALGRLKQGLDEKHA